MHTQPLIHVTTRTPTPTQPTLTLRIHHHDTDDYDITAAGRASHLAIRAIYRRGHATHVVFHDDFVVATFGHPYHQQTGQPGVVWYRSRTGTWEGHTSLISALRTLATRHLPRRQETTE